jgi:hypothetical protein
LLKSKLVSADLHHSYLMDMHSVLFPSLQNGELLKRMVYCVEIDDRDIPDGWTVQRLRSDFLQLITNYVWGSITRLTEMVAEKQVRSSPTINVADTEPKDDGAPPLKRPKTLDRLSLMLNQPVYKTAAVITPETVASDEIKLFLSIEAKVNPQDISSWWGAQPQYSNMPCLSQVALALFANKMSSGGLECDIGGMNDVIAPKRSSLRAGLIEVNMFLKLNKDLYHSLDPADVVKLDSRWESFIPRRPVMEEYDEDDGGETKAAQSDENNLDSMDASEVVNMEDVD